jgi:hypothetical protein
MKIPLVTDSLVGHTLTVTLYSGPRLDPKTPIPPERVLLVAPGTIQPGGVVASMKSKVIASGTAEWARYAIPSILDWVQDVPVDVANASPDDAFIMRTRDVAGGQEIDVWVRLHGEWRQ